jgi:hypothetical protein
MNPDPWYYSLLNSLPSGLVGAAVVYYFGVRQLIAQRRIGFVERQLSEFYAPLAGIRKQILAKREVRQKIVAAAEAAWQEICKSYEGRLMHDHAERFAPFDKIIQYDNKQFLEELLPKYREMLSLFTDRYHLAAPETRAFYQELVEFVEIWNRWLAESLPREVVAKLGHSEEKLQPFYDHIEAKMQALQQEVAQGKTPAA